MGYGTAGMWGLPVTEKPEDIKKQRDLYRNALQQIEARPPVPTIFRLVDKALHPEEEK